MSFDSNKGEIIVIIFKQCWHYAGKSIFYQLDVLVLAKIFWHFVAEIIPNSHMHCINGLFNGCGVNLVKSNW